jgi:hypothetical protein
MGIQNHLPAHISNAELRVRFFQLHGTVVLEKHHRCNDELSGHLVLALGYRRT